MVSSRFYKAVKLQRTSQAPKTRAPRVKLSKEARAILGIRQKKAQAGYQKDLEEYWAYTQEKAADIAETHGKSLKRVLLAMHTGQRALSRPRHTKASAWNAYVWNNAQDKKAAGLKGRDALEKLVGLDEKEAYKTLNDEEKEELTRQFEEHKATKAMAYRSSAKSRVNDVTHTVKSIKYELINLKSRTGVEAVMFLTRGTTDLCLQGISFATEGVERFLPDVMKVDPQDFMGRLEGYAIQGLKGAAKNAKQRVTSARTELRNMINAALAKTVGIPGLTMKWKNYWQDIVKEHCVVIEGWPDDIAFGNLSKVAMSIPALERLQMLWETEQISFRSIGDEEFRKLERERKERIENGEEIEQTRKVRRDAGRTRKGSSAAKSHAHIDSGDESDKENEY